MQAAATGGSRPGSSRPLIALTAGVAGLTSRVPDTASRSPAAATTSSTPATPAPSASPPRAPAPSPLTWTRAIDDPRLHQHVSSVAIALAPTGGFVAIVSSGDYPDTPAVLLSNDGRKWHKVGTLPNAVGARVRGLATGGGWVIATGTAAMDSSVSASSGGGAWVSTNGVDWTSVSGTPAFAGIQLGRVAFNRGTFVAVGGGDPFQVPAVVAVSTGGSAWTKVTLSDFTPGIATVSDVAAAGPGFVAVGTVDSAAATWASEDGLRWIRGSIADAPDGGFTAVAARGDHIVAMGPVRLPGDGATDPPTGTAAWVSTDGGASWIRAGMVPGLEADAGVAALPDRFVAMGSAGSVVAVWSSIDGSRWDRDRVVGSDPDWGTTDDWVDGLAIDGSRAVIAGRTVGTGMGGDRPVFWTAALAAAP